MNPKEKKTKNSWIQSTVCCPPFFLLQFCLHRKIIPELLIRNSLSLHRSSSTGNPPLPCCSSRAALTLTIPPGTRESHSQQHHSHRKEPAHEIMRRLKKVWAKTIGGIDNTQLYEVTCVCSSTGDYITIQIHPDGCEDEQHISSSSYYAGTKPKYSGCIHSIKWLIGTKLPRKISSWTNICVIRTV